MRGHQQPGDSSIGQTGFQLRRLASVEHRMRHAGRFEMAGELGEDSGLRLIERDLQRPGTLVLHGQAGFDLETPDEFIPQRDRAGAQAKERW